MKLRLQPELRLEQVLADQLLVQRVAQHEEETI